MSEWITDREPTEADADYMGAVWVTNQRGEVYRVSYEHATIGVHVAWQPIVPPEPYVKPKRYEVRRWIMDEDCFIWDLKEDNYATSLLPTREAAERIAAIYEEVMP